jgi:hypothetical protein
MEVVMDRLITKKVSVVVLVAVLSFGVCANAQYPWGMDGMTTFQQWSFSQWDLGPVQPDAGWDNKYGTDELPSPYMVVTGGNYQFKSISGHTGIWALGELDFLIPNYPVAQPEKDIRIEITWKGAELTFLPDTPLVGVVGFYNDEEIIPSVQILQDAPVPGTDGWKTSVFNISIWPNPANEWIAVKGDIYVDRVTIDTICIPEPATFGLLIGGAFMAIRRNRKK